MKNVYSISKNSGYTYIWTNDLDTVVEWARVNNVLVERINQVYKATVGKVNVGYVEGSDTLEYQDFRVNIPVIKEILYMLSAIDVKAVNVGYADQLSECHIQVLAKDEGLFRTWLAFVGAELTETYSSTYTHEHYRLKGIRIEWVY